MLISASRVYIHSADVIQPLLCVSHHTRGWRQREKQNMEPVFTSLATEDIDV